MKAIVGEDDEDQQPPLIRNNSNEENSQEKQMDNPAGILVIPSRGPRQSILAKMAIQRK